MLDISLAQSGPYNAAYNMFSTVEGLGHYWNYDSTRMDNDGMVISRPRFVGNLGPSQWMGPPAGSWLAEAARFYSALAAA
ncbi:MAG: hypothetical protein H7Y33_01805 [Cytophagales bacterium]|nr:hypothetical protein [Rhizobacter sp.]